MPIALILVTTLACSSTATGPKGEAGADGARGATGSPGADGKAGADGATGPAGTAARTLFHILLDTTGAECHLTPADNVVVLRSECCPEGFSVMGSESRRVICGEDEPARSRVALVLDVSADQEHCNVVGSLCCAAGYSFVGWDAEGFVCLQD